MGRISDAGWVAVVAVKGAAGAKSRLAALSASPQEHRTLVEAIVSDTLRAVHAAALPTRVVVVGDEPDPWVSVVPERPGLNAAFEAGLSVVGGGESVVLLVGDLPALKPQELDAALRAAPRAQGSFVADHTGDGTTALFLPAGVRSEPRFGLHSAREHARALIGLPAGPGLRLDVDIPGDLAAAARLGLGPQTAPLWLARAQDQRQVENERAGSKPAESLENHEPWRVWATAWKG